MALHGINTYECAMLKPYPPTVFELLAQLNRSALGWLAGAAERSPIWQANECQAAPTPSDAGRLATIVGSVNLWVGEGTMFRDSPSLELACADLKAWASGKPARLYILETCCELLKAVQDFELAPKVAA